MKYDLLIIGSGGAGLTAALEAKANNINAVIVSEGYPTRSQTCMAQGGINAALGNIAEDSVSAHIEDTLKASGGIASKRMVQELCEYAPETVYWLDSIGVPFSRTKENKIAQRRLGGTSGIRACYSQDYTGLKILHTLYDQVLKEEIPLLNERFLLDLSIHENRIHGAVFYNIRNGEIEYISAKSVVLATGGYSAIYHGFTTNTNQSTGDGIAAALRAGAKLSNMEFIQFHPTGLKDSGILISESARGAGGKLLNAKGERFVDELKPRDQVSRAIWQEMQKGEDIYLDIRHLGETFIDENIPQERKLCLTYAGIDPVSELIPIAPVAHYSMGGIAVDASLMSSIEGLFAAGECSNAEVHGANRLGGNSLLEIITFGRKAGKNAALFAHKYPHNSTLPINDKITKAKKIIHSLLDNPNSEDFYTKRNNLGKLFYKNAGIIREAEKLEEALHEIEQIENLLPQMGVFDKGCTYNTNLIERIKFSNTLLLSKCLLNAALARKESRGAHYRKGYPETNPEFEKESITSMKENTIVTEFQKVTL
jgi:succinate dehydrogenase / fumarate reductase flavoprotein subunit